MTDDNMDIICLVGPTGSGKTGAALHLARFLERRGVPMAVINADSRQLYADFPLITAQPSPEERQVCPHLLYGYLPTTEKSSAGQWMDKTRQAVKETAAAGRLPVLVGGTGLYIKALLDGMTDIPAPSPAMSASLQQECETLGPEVLHERLQTVDPAYAVRIHPHDRQRIVRALEVWESTGHTFTWWHAQTPPGEPWNALRLGIGLPLPELTPMLATRIRAMLAAGAMEEAKAALAACPDLNAPGWSGIGCAEAGAFLTGHMNLEECITAWTRNTRAYAKRQWTWFRADRRVAWLRPGEYASLETQVLQFLEHGNR